MKIFKEVDFVTLKKLKKDWKDRLLAGVIMGVITIILYLVFWAWIMDLSASNFYGIFLSFLIGFILGFVFKEVELLLPF